jgi:hypothetical protein
LAHYVERHAIMVPDEFVVRASARGWEVPPKDQIPQCGEAEYDYSFWRQWAKSLPDIPEVATLPDPRVVERSCLILQYPEANGLDNRLVEAFEDIVWDKVREQYGRYSGRFGDEQYIEWVVGEHRETGQPDP